MQHAAEPHSSEYTESRYDLKNNPRDELSILDPSSTEIFLPQSNAIEAPNKHKPLYPKYRSTALTIHSFCILAVCKIIIHLWHSECSLGPEGDGNESVTYAGKVVTGQFHVLGSSDTWGHAGCHTAGSNSKASHHLKLFLHTPH